MKYNVTAVAVDPETRQRILFMGTEKERVEEIDTATNELFKKAKTARDVERTYEMFWNDLVPRPSAIVKVVDVRRVS